MKKILLAVALLTFPTQTVLGSNYDGNYKCNPKIMYFEQGAIATRAGNGLQFVSVGMTKNDIKTVQQQSKEIYDYASFDLVITDNSGEIRFGNATETKYFRLIQRVDALEKEYQVGIWDRDISTFTELFVYDMLRQAEDIQRRLERDYSNEFLIEELDKILADIVFHFFERENGRDFKLEISGDENDQIMFSASNVSSFFDFGISLNYFKATCELKS